MEKSLQTSASSGMTRRALLGCLGAAGLAGTGWLWMERPHRWRRGFTIQLLPPEASQGLVPGLQWVVQTHLAALAPACVVNIPGAQTPLPAKRRAFQLQLRPHRQDELLTLNFRWRRAGGAWIDVPGNPASPAHAMAAFLDALPEDFDPDSKGLLLPEQPGLAWELIDLASVRTALFRTPGLRARLDRLVTQAPECALAWCLFGRASYLELLERRDWVPEDRALAETCLNRSLHLVPGLPSAAGELSQMLSDFGENGAALRVLAAAIRIHPHSEVLLRRLAYSARNAGLLEVARLAVLAREQGMGHLEGIENTLLYFGEFQRFEEGILTEVQRKGPGPAHRFYLAYSALLQGDQAKALQHLREAEGRWSESRFGRIGFTLWTFLEGRTQESLDALDKLVQQHLSLRTPDGEFILKLAELMTLHGKENRALDLATRAAHRGFGCTRWYEHSPLLAPIRGFLRFQALLHTLRERQAAQADHFPPGAFGF